MYKVLQGFLNNCIDRKMMKSDRKNSLLYVSIKDSSSHEDFTREVEI